MRLDIDPKIDYAFKKVFGTETNAPVLIDILHAVLLPNPGGFIDAVRFLTPFSDRDSLDDKLSILDVRVRDQGERQFNVEMQMRFAWYFPSRALYYWAKFHQQQLVEGDFYQTLRPTISIFFVNDIAFPTIPEHNVEFRPWDKGHRVTFTDDMRLHVIQLPRFTKGLGELATPLDRWCWFLRHGDSLDPDHIPAPLDVPPIRRAVEVLQVLSQTESERYRYEARQKALRDEASERYEMEHGWKRVAEMARKEGQERGLLLGRINLCEEMLGRPVTPGDALAALSLEDLNVLAARLQNDVRNVPRVG